MLLQPAPCMCDVRDDCVEANGFRSAFTHEAFFVVWSKPTYSHRSTTSFHHFLFILILMMSTKLIHAGEWEKKSNWKRQCGHYRPQSAERNRDFDRLTDWPFTRLLYAVPDPYTPRYFYEPFNKIPASETQMQHSGLKHKVSPDFGMLNRFMNSVFLENQPSFRVYSIYTRYLFYCIEDFIVFIDPNPLDLTGRPVLGQLYFFYVDLIAIISIGHRSQDYGVSGLGSVNIQ